MKKKELKGLRKLVGHSIPSGAAGLNVSQTMTDLRGDSAKRPVPQDHRL